MVKSMMPIEDGYSVNISTPVKIEGDLLRLRVSDLYFLNKMREYMNFVIEAANAGRSDIDYTVPKIVLNAELKTLT